MGASNGRTKRSVERGPGKREDRRRGAQTSRQEAQAMELISRAFATEGGLLYPEREHDPDRGYSRGAWVDKEVIQRGKERDSLQSEFWPYPSRGAGDAWDDGRGRMIRQRDQQRDGNNPRDYSRMGARDMSTGWDRGTGLEAFPVRATFGDWQDWRPDNYFEYSNRKEQGPMSERDGFIEALGRLFGR